MFRTLLAVRLRAEFARWTGAGRRGKTRSAAAKAGIAALMLYVAACFVYLFYNMFHALAAPLFGAGLGWLYGALSGVLAAALAVVSAAFAAQTQLYEAKDNDLLFSMPVPPSAILGSRMAALYADCFLSSVLVLLPASAARWGIDPPNGAGIAALVLALLLLPLLALTAACLLGWINAKVASRMRRKSLASIVLTLAFLAAYFLVFSRMEQYLRWIAENAATIAVRVRRSLYPFYQLGLAMQGDLGALGLFALCAVVPFAAACRLLAASLLRIASAKPGAAKVRYRERAEKILTPDRALLRRESARFFASAAYFLNGGLGTVFLLAAAVLFQARRTMLLRLTASAFGLRGVLPALLCLAISLAAGMNMISASSVSMEGKTLWLVKSLPVGGWQVLRSKLRLHILFTAPAAALAGLSAALALRLPLWETLLLAAFPAAYSVLTAEIGLCLNLRFPRLDWINETAAVKQGASVLLALLTGAGIPAVAAGLYALVLRRALSASAWTAVCLELTACGALALRRYLRGRGAARFAEIF